MAWKPVPSLPLSEQKPLDLTTLEKAYAGWTTDQLLEELTRINGQLETQTRSVVTSQLQPDLDQPVVRSPRMVALSRPPDHDPQRSRPSQPTALDLLISGSRMGPRLARKLAIASARARSSSR